MPPQFALTLTAVWPLRNYRPDRPLEIIRLGRGKQEALLCYILAHDWCVLMAGFDSQRFNCLGVVPVSRTQQLHFLGQVARRRDGQRRAPMAPDWLLRLEDGPPIDR